MPKLAEAMNNIDESLRFAFFGLECVLRIEFKAKEVERVFSDAVNDQRSAKEYVFIKIDKLVVSGYVDEYEPEMIHLHIESKIIDQSLVTSILERAKYQAMRMEKARTRFI